MQPGSRTRALLPPAVEWQCCQLLRETSEPNYIIKIRPCAQQQNGMDCGLYAIANMVSLAFGYDPEMLVYTGDLRKEFLGMILDKKIKMFQHKLKSDIHLWCFKTPVRGTRADDSIEIPDSLTEMIVPICHCKMTESFGDIISCDKCDKKYHRRCYLMGGTVGCKRPKQFICYGCRNPLDYAFLDKMSPINVTAIEKCSLKIAALDNYVLAKYCSEVQIPQVGCIPHCIKDFNKIEHIISTYDLNSFCRNQGNIYQSFFNLYVNNYKNLPNQKKIENYSIAQLVHFVLLLICDTELIPCSPISVSYTHLTLPTIYSV